MFGAGALARAQGNAPGEIRQVDITRAANGTQVEVTISAAVDPKVIIAENPPRLVLEFANTLAGARQQHIAFGQDGIKSVRVGLTSQNPPVSRVVIDLDAARPYGLSRDGNKVTLTVLPSALASTSSGGSGAPGAAGVPLFGRLRRRRNPVASVSVEVTPAPVPPPSTSRAPLRFPDSEGASQANASAPAVAASPTAAHPNYGSLQQGTVFPGIGAPGTGVVPRAAGENAGNQRSDSTGGVAAVPESARVGEPPATMPTATVAMVVTPAASVSKSVQQDAVSGTEIKQAPVHTAASAQPNIQTPPLSSPAPIQAPAVAVSASRMIAVASLQPPEAGKPSAAEIQKPVAAAPIVTAPQPPNPVSTAAVASASSPSTVAVASAPSNADREGMLPVLSSRQPNADVRTAFKVKYVAEGAAYLDAGRSSGLSEGMKLEVRDTQPAAPKMDTGNEEGLQTVAELKVISIAETSAVTEIIQPKRDVKPGDLAYLSSEDTQALVAQRSLSATRKYPTVISFTEGDPLEEEAREEVPRPPLPEVNRARGRVGVDYSGIFSHGAVGSTSSNIGMVVRTDISRIGGSYWNMSGYWRGRFTKNSSSTTPTLQDLINRTYHLALTYDNPQSRWVAGVGRLYLPWATSLDTIDGGYFGRRVGTGMTVGLFAGSTPDPTSWSYAPDQQMGGMFVNFEGGSFDNFRYTSTSGTGVQMLKWKINRPFLFFENGLFYKRIFSIYSAVQADRPASNPAVTSPGAGVSRAFTTLRIQPIERFEFDVNHTYFRDVPNFDPQLIGTGLLDKYLFQGFSAGPRIEVLKKIWVYATLGKSSRSGEAKSSLNQLYGITFGELPYKFRADLRYSRFNSSYGNGDYKAFSLSRNFRDNFRWELLAGQQAYTSTLATSNKSHFVNANLEAPIGPHYFLQGGWTWNRGGTMNYDQWFTTFGYRFDSWHRGNK